MLAANLSPNIHQPTTSSTLSAENPMRWPEELLVLFEKALTVE